MQLCFFYFRFQVSSTNSHKSWTKLEHWATCTAALAPVFQVKIIYLQYCREGSIRYSQRKFVVALIIAQVKRGKRQHARLTCRLRRRRQTKRPSVCSIQINRPPRLDCRSALTTSLCLRFTIMCQVPRLRRTEAHPHRPRGNAAPVPLQK